MKNEVPRKMTKKRPKSFLENRKMDIYKCPFSCWGETFLKKNICD